MSDPNLTLHYNFAVDQSLVARIGPTLGITRTTSATFFNSSGLIETAASGVARFEYDPITRISLGIFIEETRENVCLHNRDGTDAVWVKLNMTAAKDQVGEDGVANSATSLLATAGNATAIQSFTIGSTAQTGTFSLKRLIGTGDVDITIDDGVTFTTVSINSLTYTRFDVTQTLANPDIGVRIVTSGDKIAIDFQGLEAGAFPTSRIATVASSVTRNQDEFITTDVSWYNSAASTLYVKASTPQVVQTTAMSVNINDGSTSDRLVHFRSNITNDRVNTESTTGAGGSSSVNSVWTVNTTRRSAIGYALNDLIISSEGVAGPQDTSAPLPVGISQMNVGANNDLTTPWNGHIAEIRYYNVRKDNTFLESLSNGIINEDSINLSTNLARPIVRNIARPY